MGLSSQPPPKIKVRARALRASPGRGSRAPATYGRRGEGCVIRLLALTLEAWELIGDGEGLLVKARR